MHIRPEAPGDAAAIHAAVVSLVATLHGEIIGHVLFSPVEVNQSRGLGVAPVAVLPGRQLELRPVALAGVRGVVRYCEEFSQLG